MGCAVPLFVIGLTVLTVITQVHRVETQDIDPQCGRADGLLNKLREKLGKGAKIGQKALDDAKNDVNEMADETRNAAKEKMQGIGDGFKADVEKLRKKAEINKVDIKDCLNDYETKLGDLRNRLSNEIASCISDKVNLGTKYAEDGSKQVKTIVERIKDIRRKIKKCRRGSKRIKCVKNLIGEIKRYITSLPKKIRADVDATVSLITKLEAEVEKCASSKVDEYQNEGKRVVETFAKCVDEKIYNNAGKDGNDGKH